MTANSDQMPRVTAGWLRLREPADAAARAADLVDALRPRFAGAARLTVHDLGCGTGSMGRWLAALLPVPQHWVLYDRDPDLLVEAAADLALTAAAEVTVDTRHLDVADLTAADLAEADLVTASALLDLLTAEEVATIVRVTVEAGCPALLTLSVTGRAALDPADPLDDAVAAAFDAHQRRWVGGRRLLGPDAVAAILDAYAREGVSTRLGASPWRLGPDRADLLAEWFEEWLDAAFEHDPGLAARVVLSGYAERRRAQIESGRLTAAVPHLDVLARP
jgi:SAM-dependent methyltransferase